MAVDAALLQKIPLFAGLNESQRAAAASKLEERVVAEGTHVSNEGGAGYFFFAIAEGTARVTRGDETLAELGPGDFFGEAAVLKTPRRTATVVAMTPMTLLAMFGADFAKLAADEPTVAAVIDAALAERLPD
jgi:CRP-like cAMP-binding protein